MNINDLTIGQFKELTAMMKKESDNEESLPFKVGDIILIRTVTMIQVGTVEAITAQFIQLRDAGWVADSGRFGECLANGTLSEFERAPSWVLVSRGAIVDVYPWDHEVPAESL